MFKKSFDDRADFLAALKVAFVRERVICRVIASWTLFAAIKVLGEGTFSDLSFAQGTSLSLLALYVLLFFGLLSAVNMLFCRFQTDTWFLMLGATVCVVEWLSTYSGGKEFNLVAWAVILVYSMFAFYFVQQNQELLTMIKPGKRVTLTVAIVAGLASATIISVVCCMRQITFATPNFDFGLFVNMFHNMKETGLPYATSERDMFLSHFAVHISPIYYLLLPFYCIFPSPHTLQIGQAVIVASGVIPVWLLARHFKLSGRMQILVTCIYSLYPAATVGCFYDLHENCFLLPLLLWTFYFFEREKYLPMYLFAFGVLLVKEDAAMYLIMFALFVIISKKKYLHGFILAAGALLYFGFALIMLDTYGTGVMVNRFDNLIFNKDDGLMGAVKTALVNPGFLLTQLFTTSKNNWDKIIYVFQMFLPLGFIPFVSRKPSRWLLMTPILMNLLTYYQYQYSIGFQYSFGVSAFLIYAMLINLPELHTPSKKVLVTIGVVASCCFYLTAALPKVEYYFNRWEENREDYTIMEKALDELPADASLNVSTYLLSHVADRSEVYQAKYGDLYHGDKPDVDYVVLDIRGINMNKETNEVVKLRNAYLGHGYTVEEEVIGSNGKAILLILKSPNA